MTDEKWQKVREVFDSALSRKPEERREFINGICGVDKKLLREVESLLSSLDSADRFLETPAIAKVADVIEAETKSLKTGKCFGHYEIIEQIGAGGMGEVYLAKDQKLDRHVAVKILNERFSRDESNLQRFVSEAKAASALNHPNILVIHEIGEEENTHYIVSEFIKGVTLREVFQKKSLNLPEILDISVQTANALTAAHEASLIHRDIKPENIMIRPDGYVKILDFGLAKLVERKNKSILGFEDSTVKQNQTAKGVILGTVNYMSPEQAKGEQVDQRTDIFSLGVLIYEMVAGRTPFAGDTMSETFANLINREPPPLARFAASVPDELQRIVSKMLCKNKTERFQTMKDGLTDLKELQENLTLDEKLKKSRSPENKIAAAVLPATTGDTNKQTAENPLGFTPTNKRLSPSAAETGIFDFPETTKRRKGLFRGLKFLLCGLAVGFVFIILIQVLHILGSILFQYENNLPGGASNPLADMLGNLLNMVLLPVLLGCFAGAGLFLFGNARIVYAFFEKENSKTNASSIERLMAAVITVFILTIAIPNLIASYREGNRARQLQQISESKNASEPFRQVRLNRLTSIGNVGKVALSPDGNLVVYETKEKEGVSLWVRQTEMSNAVNLVPVKKGNITFLTFSPDGKLVYYGFFAGDNSTAELYSVPALGGANRKIKTDIATNFMAFAPDGRRYAQVNSNLREGEKYLVINSLDDAEEIRLAVRKTPRSFNITGQFCAWSPDGKTIAAISSEVDADGQFSTLVGVNAADGSEKLLSAKRWNELNSVQWLKDANGLLVTATDARHGSRQIWFVNTDGEVRMLTNDLNDYSYLGVTADGKQIVSVQESQISGVWLGTVGQSENDFKELISETGTLDSIASAANGDIIFRSNADGQTNLWKIGNGGERKQLTIDTQVDGRGLCAAPDGGQIVFPSRKADKVNLWRVDAGGGDAEQLTFGDGEFFPVCLPGNRGIIYQKGSGYGIKSTLWKISFDGGEPIQITDYYAIRPASSPDGSRVAFFYIKNEKWSIGIVSSDGGKIEQNFEVPNGVLDRTLRWSPDGQSIFYISNEGKIGNVWSLPLNGQSPKQITDFNSHSLVDFVPSQNGKGLVVTRTVELGDVVTITEE